MPHKNYFMRQDDEHTRVKKVRTMSETTDVTVHLQNEELSDTHTREAGTQEYDLKDVPDHISEEGHPVPVILIEDHFAELAQGINPATCLKCGAPMELHAQFEPTMQHYTASVDESLPAHLASEHGFPNLGELDPEEDGLILDRLYEIHEAKHVAASEAEDGPAWDDPRVRGPVSTEELNRRRRNGDWREDPMELPPPPPDKPFPFEPKERKRSPLQDF